MAVSGLIVIALMTVLAMTYATPGVRVARLSSNKIPPIPEIKEKLSQIAGGCDPTSSGAISRFKQMSDSVKDKIRTFMEDGDFSTLSDSELHIIPEHCRKLAFEKKKTVSTSDFVHLVKQNQRSPQIIKQLFRKVSNYSDVIKTLSHDVTKTMTKTAKRILANQLLRSKGGADKLDVKDISTMPADIIAETDQQALMRFKPEAFKAYMGRFYTDMSVQDLNNRQLKGIQAAVKKQYKSMQIIDATNFALIKPFINCIPLSVCKKLPKDILLDNLAEFGSGTLACEFHRSSEKKHTCPDAFSCAKLIAKRLMGDNPADFLSNSTLVSRLGSLKSCLGKQQMKTALTQMTCSDVAHSNDINSLNPKVVREMMLKCAPQHLHNLTVSDITSSVGRLMQSLPPQKLRQIPKAVLCDSSVRDLMKRTWTDHSKRAMRKRAMRKKDAHYASRAVVTKLCSENEVFDSAKLSEYSDMADTIPRKVWKTMSRDVLKSQKSVIINAMKSMHSVRGAKATARVLARQLSEDLSLMVESKELMETMSQKEVCDRVTDVDADLGLNAGLSPDLTASQDLCIMEKVISQTSPEDMTEEFLRGKKSLVLGLALDHLKRLNTEERLAIARTLAEQEKWPANKLDALTSFLIIPGLKELNSSHYMKELTMADVEDMEGRPFMFMEKSDLENTDPDVCSEICSQIGNDDKAKCLMTRTKCQEVASACLKCLGADNMNSLDSDILSVLGNNLLSCVDSSVLDKISDSVSTLSAFRGGCFPRDLQRKVATKVENIFRSAGDALDIGTVGSLAALIDKNILYNLPEFDSIMADMGEDIAEDLEPTDEEDQEIEKCCIHRLSPEDRVERDSWKAKQREIRLHLMRDGAATQRRKRTTPSWTCADVQTLGSSVTQATDAELTSLSASEFVECLPTLGDISAWSDAQKTLLLNKVKSDVGSGSLCSLSSEDLSNMGYLATGLTSSDISCLDNLDNDAVAALGGLSSWSEEQLRSLMAAHKVKNNVTAAGLDSEAVSILGHILCGFTAEEIAQIPVDVYVNSSALIGGLVSCGSSELAALKTLASDAGSYGAVSTWTASVFSDVGIVLGALNSAELVSVPESAIEGWRGSGISHIHPDSFKDLSLSQLQAFSMDQARAVTSAQKAVLTSDQLKVIDPNDMISGAGVIVLLNKILFVSVGMLHTSVYFS